LGWVVLNILNQDEVGTWIRKLIVEDKLEEFYNSKYWRRLRKEVLIEYKYECQDCKAKGFYTKADTVHHQQYVRKHPRLALSKMYMFQGKEYKNLIPLCHNHHEIRHGYRQKEIKQPLTEERW
jgi:5-methylcytosine-specific restriction endonuclease McrA